MKVNTHSEHTTAPIAATGFGLTVKGYEPLSVLTRQSSLQTHQIKPMPLRIHFNGSDGTQSLFIVDKGTVSFEGSPDAAAKQFIDALTRKHAEQWIELEQRAQAAEAELARYSSHNALMTLSHQLVAAHRELEALRQKNAQYRHDRYSEESIHCNQQIICSDQLRPWGIIGIDPAIGHAYNDGADS